VPEPYREGGFIDCERCGQYRTLNVSGVCEICRAAERQPQGEAVRLFTPAPAQLPGQLNL
jgi:hypothetical protein